MDRPNVGGRYIHAEGSDDRNSKSELSQWSVSAPFRVIDMMERVAARWQWRNTEAKGDFLRWCDLTS